MSDSGHVVVTGLGVVAGGAAGVEPLRARLEGGEPPVEPVERLPALHRRSDAGSKVSVERVDLSPWLSPSVARRMSRPSRLAVAAARMAVDGSASYGERATEGATAVIFATSYGPSEMTERILNQIQSEGPTAVSPFLFTESVANAPAAQVALSLEAHGPNITITQREAGPLLALQRGVRELLSGRVDRVLVGAVDEVTPLLHAILDRFGALAGRRNGNSEAAQPFGRHRDGYLAGEGAAVLVLERARDLRPGDRRPLARVLSGGAGFDPTASSTGWGSEPEAMADRVRRDLLEADLSLAAIGGIVASASGSRDGDRYEGLMLRALFGGRTPPVVAPKGVIGEVGAALLATPILMLDGVRFGGPLRGFQPDPEIGITPHSGAVPRGPLLITAPAVGGAFAWSTLASGGRR